MLSQQLGRSFINGIKCQSPCNSAAHNFIVAAQMNCFSAFGEMLHLKVNAEPWGFFDEGSIRFLLLTIKAILYMEKKLSLLARRLAYPLLASTSDNERDRVCKEDFMRVKTALETRPDGMDIYNDGLIAKIEEVYKNVGQSRQLVESPLEHFRKDLTAELGVTEIAHDT